jgi:hypothetical protein
MPTMPVSRWRRGLQKSGSSRSRGELVDQIFLEHYVPGWEDMTDMLAGWLGKASPIPVGIDPGPAEVANSGY